MSNHDDMLDAVGLLWSIMVKRSYYVFNDDGTFTEHEQLPAIVNLTQYARASNTDVWWSVQLQTGMNIPTWNACTPEDVPSGLRLMALLIAQ